MHHLTILMILDLFLVPLLRSGLKSQMGNDLMSTITILKMRSNNTGRRYDENGNLTSLFEEMDKHLEKFDENFQGCNHSEKVKMVQNVKQDQMIAFEHARIAEQVARVANQTASTVKRDIATMEAELTRLKGKIRNDTMVNGGGLFARFVAQAEGYKKRKLERRVSEMERQLKNLKQTALIVKDKAAKTADQAMRKLITWAELKRIEVEYQNEI